MSDAPQLGSQEWWVRYDAASLRRRQRLLRTGLYNADAEIALAFELQPLRDAGGELAAQAAWRQANRYATAALMLEGEAAAWYRREAVACFEAAGQTTDAQLRNDAYQLMLSELDRDGDWRRMNDVLEQWRSVLRAPVPSEEDWRSRIHRHELAPLTVAEKQRIVSVMQTWARRLATGDDDVLLHTADTLGIKFRSADDVRKLAESPQAVREFLFRHIATLRIDRSLDEILEPFERNGVPRAKDSHLHRYPIAVRARGTALNLVAASERQAFEAYARRGMDRGEVYGYSYKGEHRLGGPTSSRAAMLYVPAGARAESYPRSVNGVDIFLMRRASPLHL